MAGEGLSRTGVVNQALIYLKRGTIADLDSDTTNAGVVMRELYERSLDAEIESARWTFATRFLDFGAAAAEAPAFDWAYAHNFPADPHAIRVLDLHPPGTPFAVVGRQVYSQWQTVMGRCLVRVTEPANWSPLFFKAFAHRLAYEAAWAITGSEKVAALMERRWLAFRAEARGIDAQSGTPDNLLGAEDILDARYGS